MSLGKLSMDKYTLSFPICCLAEECDFELNWRRGFPWIYFIYWIWLEMRFDSFSRESDSFDQINQSCRTYFVFSLHIHFIQAPSGVFVKSLLRLPDIMDCVPWYTFWIYIDTSWFQMDRITNILFKIIFWTIKDNTLFRCKIRQKCLWQNHAKFTLKWDGIHITVAVLSRSQKQSLVMVTNTKVCWEKRHFMSRNEMEFPLRWIPHAWLVKV